ncbi:MAG: hypothetical protein KA974_02035, partial [Saprospiraceae bacterium]|nr:hypothetical protein [Saprospiraceae bacterium]
MQKSTIILSLAMFSLGMQIAFGQGCSDAGFCTLNSIKPANENSMTTPPNQIKIGAFYGTADNSITVWGNYLEYNRQVTDNFGLDAKVTTLAQSGNNINTFGAGDLFLSGNYHQQNFNLTLGAKIPFADGNKKLENLSLPMDYQSSLGTVDLVASVGYEIKKLHFVLAYQQPLTQNKNQFFSEIYPTDSPLRNFQTTNAFKRSGDILLRISYPINVVQNLKITPSLLPIFHLTNDKYTDITGVEKEITGSQGLTLNGNIYLDYNINT